MPATAPRAAAIPVAVIGLNARSEAVIRALAERGHPVGVWDAGDATDSGPAPGTVRRAASPAEAVAAGDLVVVLTEDYGAAQQALGPAASEIADRDVVNLTSGTSAQAQEVAAWVAARGGRYLDGALMAHPEHVGHPDTVLVYSGSAELYERHEAVLRRLGSATYLGPDPGSAALYDLSMLNFAWATLVGFLQTSALLATGDVPARTVAPLLTHWLSTTVADVIRDYAEQVDTGRYPGDEEWLELDAPLMDHLVEATEERGLDPELPRLIQALTSKGIAAGHGSDSFASLVEIIRAGEDRPDSP